MLIAQVLLLRNVGGMSVSDHDRLLILADPARAPFDPCLFPRKCMPSELGASIDIGSCVQRAVQDVQDPLMRQTTPDQFICTLAAPPARWEIQVLARWEIQVLLSKETDDGES